MGGTNRANRTCRDRKSTRLNSSHVSISYAVFCLKKKRHLDALVQGEAPELRVQVVWVHLEPEGSGAAGDDVRRDARQQARVQGDEQAQQGLLSHVSRGRD